MARSIGRSRRGTLFLTLSASLVAFEGAASAQGTLSYYFAHIASAGVWRTSFTYVNQTTLPVTCNTSFYSDTGSPLPLSFNGASFTSTTDTIPAGGVARRQTDAQTSQPVVTGWAAANCTGPVKASALFRSYNGNVAQAEASVPAMTFPANQFVTYADQATGVAYANPSPDAATVTFTAKNQTGAVIGSQSISLPAGGPRLPEPGTPARFDQLPGVDHPLFLDAHYQLVVERRGRVCYFFAAARAAGRPSHHRSGGLLFCPHCHGQRLAYHFYVRERFEPGGYL
ncbi:MAG: hypothetical protein ACLQU1_01625 [Bryobacteraceae bacterium]